MTASRRSFLKTTAASAALLSALPAVHAAGSDELKVGLVGCGSPRGGRGRGAAIQACMAGPGIRLTAMGDLFADHLEFSKGVIKQEIGDRYVVPDDHCFV